MVNEQAQELIHKRVFYKFQCKKLSCICPSTRWSCQEYESCNACGHGMEKEDKNCNFEYACKCKRSIIRSQNEIDWASKYDCPHCKKLIQKVINK